MNKKELAAQVDAVGALRDKIHALKFQEGVQTLLIKEHLRKQKAGKRKAEGEKYEAELKQDEGLVIEDLPRFKRAAGRKFIRCVKVNLALARSELGADKVQSLGVTKKLPDVLKVYKREPAKAPRRANGRKKK